jgi:hypothetical protein
MSQPRKVERSGLSEAVNGNVLIEPIDPLLDCDLQSLLGAGKVRQSKVSDQLKTGGVRQTWE